MNSKKGFLLLLLSVLALTICACGEKQSTDVKIDIVGTWISDDDSLTIEFTTDQKIHSVYNTGNISINMNSETVWVDENILLGVWEPNISTWKVRIWGDKMELKSDDGRKLIMYRSK